MYLGSQSSHGFGILVVSGYCLQSVQNALKWSQQTQFRKTYCRAVTATARSNVLNATVSFSTSQDMPEETPTTLPSLVTGMGGSPLDPLGSIVVVGQHVTWMHGVQINLFYCSFRFYWSHYCHNDQSWMFTYWWSVYCRFCSLPSSTKETTLLVWSIFTSISNWNWRQLH